MQTRFPVDQGFKTNKNTDLKLVIMVTLVKVDGGLAEVEGIRGVGRGEKRG